MKTSPGPDATTFSMVVSWNVKRLELDTRLQWMVSELRVFQVVCLDIRHVTQDGEGDDAGKEAGGGVDEARDDGVLDAVVVELVVGAERGQGARPDAARAQRPSEVRT